MASATRSRCWSRGRAGRTSASSYRSSRRGCRRRTRACASPFARPSRTRCRASSSRRAGWSTTARPGRSADGPGRGAAGGVLRGARGDPARARRRAAAVRAAQRDQGAGGPVAGRQRARSRPRPGLRPRRVNTTGVRRAAEAVGETFAAHGVRHAFGLIGSGNFLVVNSLAASGVEFLSARHEGAAIVMADAYARVSGDVGVCSVHQGPGLTNATTGLVEAVKSRTPLVVLAGEMPAGALRANLKIDQAALVSSVGAGVDRLRAPATAAADAARALWRARVERRPIVLMLPIDVEAQPAPAPAA